MKKKIIILISIILIIGIICLILINVNSKNNESLKTDTKLSKVEAKQEEEEEVKSDEQEVIVEEKNEDENIVDNSNSKEINTVSQSSSSNNSSNSKNSTSSQQTTVNNKKQETTNQVEQPKTQTIWEQLGMTEDQYYNQPMYNWEHIDFSVSQYGSESAATQACLTYGDNYEPYINGEVSYNCSTVTSASGKYLGEMFYTEKLN